MSKISIYVMCLLTIYSVSAQVNVKEQVYVQLSSADLIVGETLSFSSFTYSQLDGKLSRLSKILYVEVLNENNKSVYKTKILQEKGRGYGKYFLPIELETGNYHFVAYTRWMRNFKEYFHQRIVIVNPYKNTNFDLPQKHKTTVQFHPEGGVFVSGVKNKIVVHAFDGFGAGRSIKGKVVSGTGDKIVEVETDAYGFFDFTMTPLKTDEYRFILETDDGFEFVDLPTVNEGVGVELSESTLDETINVGIKRSEGLSDQVGKLNIYSFGQLVFSKEVSLTEVQVIQKSSLPPGLLQFVIHTDQEYKRLFWNGAVKESFAKTVGEFGVLDTIDFTISLPGPASYTVVVNRSDEALSSSIGLMNEINSVIDISQSKLFYKQANKHQIDRLLISAKSNVRPVLSKDVKYLPEYRFGLVEGQVVDAQGDSKPDVVVAMALPGDIQHLNASITDSSGRFFLRYDPKHRYQAGTIFPVSETQNDYKLSIESEFYTSYPKFLNPPLFFDSMRVSGIIQRSIDNQLENAFVQRTSSGKGILQYKAVTGARSYKLSEYTRFPSTRDTFIELVPEVAVSKNEDNFDMKMRTQDIINGESKANQTLYLLDGVFTTPKDILNLSPLYIERIDVLNKKYFFGKIKFDGIVSVHTNTHDGLGTDPKGKALSLVPFQFVKVSKNDSEDKSRMPNRDPLVYWEPILNHEGGDLNLRFGASEVKGKYDIRIEGIDTTGKTIHQKYSFDVK